MAGIFRTGLKVFGIRLDDLMLRRRRIQSILCFDFARAGLQASLDVLSVGGVGRGANLAGDAS